MGVGCVIGCVRGVFVGVGCVIGCVRGVFVGVGCDWVGGGSGVGV